MFPFSKSEDIVFVEFNTAEALILPYIWFRLGGDCLYFQNICVYYV